MCNEKMTREDEEACAAFHTAASRAASRIYVFECVEQKRTERQGKREV